MVQMLHFQGLPASSRASSLPRPAARIKSRLVYNDERWSVGTIICAMPRGPRSGRYRSIPQFLPQTGILGADSRSGSL
ncbi:hypothetical protein B1F73_06645 [Pseudomonas syringae]|nr:hypothetical protein B1F77_20180 [Pseudomonas syringae]RXT84462.1 hypothetical protein B1F72_15960 [Pseudomonas syringae]RXU01416.1 hypothetical protein B1F73_06645 [Pseudomonas syringae]